MESFSSSSFFKKKASKHLCVCELNIQKQYLASDLIDILLGQETWGRPNGRQIHFPKVMGLAAGGSLLKDISGLVKAIIGDNLGIQIIPPHSKLATRSVGQCGCTYANGNDHSF